jgi:hypothetical protein
MHDGSVASLGEAVEREVRYRSRVSGEYPVLAPEEMAALVGFLRTLTDQKYVQTDTTGVGPPQPR